MREKIILKGGNNNKNSDKKKSGGSDKKKSDGSDKKKCDGSDKKKNSYKKKSGGVNETLINMDIANYEGVIQNKLMSQENATNGDGFQSGFSSSVTGGTMYGGGDAADKKLREILKNLIYDKRDDIINMLKLKFLSFANKLEQKDEDVKTYMDQLKTLFIDKNIEYGKKGVFVEVSKNPFNNIIKELKIIIDNIDINNLSKSNIGLFNFIDFDFVITKSTKINTNDILNPKPLYILRIIIKYIKNDKYIHVKEIHTFGYNNKYEIVADDNNMINIANNQSAFIQTRNKKIPELNEIYYSSTSYIDNIHKLILKKKSIETDDTISNNCAKIIYELLKKLSEDYKNKKVIDIEDIRNEKKLALDHETIFKQALINTSIPIEYLLEVLRYLNDNIDRVEPIEPAPAQGEAAPETEQTAATQVAATQVAATQVAATQVAATQVAATPAAEAEPEKKNIIKLLINKVKKCYDPCDTDNIYLNMSTNEFLKNIENYLIRIFNMENSVFIDIYDKISMAKKARYLYSLVNESKLEAAASATEAAKYKGNGKKAAEKAEKAAIAAIAAEEEAKKAEHYFNGIEIESKKIGPSGVKPYYSYLEKILNDVRANAANAANAAKEAEEAEEEGVVTPVPAAEVVIPVPSVPADTEEAEEAHDKRLNLDDDDENDGHIYTDYDEDEEEEDYDNVPNIVINSARPAGAARPKRPATAPPQ